MSLKRTVRVLVGVIATLMLAPSANAQFGQFYDSLPFGSYQHSYTDQLLHEPFYHPFIEPGYFNHDLQFFAPAADIDAYGGPVMRTGWFGSYARMYLRVSRPDHLDSFDRMDRTWGNRWDLGYMIDDVDHDHGWLFSYMKVDGPNAYDRLVRERINRLNEDDEGRPEPQQQGQGGQQQQIDVVEPPIDRNNVGPPNRQRNYYVSDSLNLGELSHVELNKLFRMEPLNHGGLLEPFFGVRYTKFDSLDQDQTYIRYDEDGFVFLDPPFPPADPANPDFVDIGDTEIEDLITDRFRYVNHMIGGQLGFRWLKRLNRWNLSSEVRAFAYHNFQQMQRRVDIERTYYDGGGQGSEVDGVVFTRNTENYHATATVVGTDIRAEAAFEVTRDISLNFGMQFLGFFTGIGRGRSLSLNSQDLIMVGGTVGIVVNH